MRVELSKCIETLDIRDPDEATVDDLRLISSAVNLFEYSIKNNRKELAMKEYRDIFLKCIDAASNKNIRKFFLENLSVDVADIFRKKGFSVLAVKEDTETLTEVEISW